ncbi:MAG: DUF4236 domain-containing protein [Ignavibacteriaceae bacterium]|jgi:hypothetical protein|nr:DUF4236 domain-containing protein [Ignavibacteriaceae bacterium]
MVNNLEGVTMGIRFRRSIKLGKHSRINIGKGTVGFSTGGKGLRLGVGSKGPYTSVGIPGTGISKMSYLGGTKTRRSNKATPSHFDVNGIKYPNSKNVYPGMGCIVSILVLIIVFVGIAVPGNSYVIIGAVILSILSAIVIYLSPGSKLRRRLEYIRLIYRQNRFEDTIVAAQEYLVNNADDKQVKFLLGMSYYRTERYIEAIDLLKGFLKEASSYDADKIFLADCYRLAKKYDESINELQQITETSADWIRAIILQAECFRDMGKRDLAIEVLKRGPLLKRNLDKDLLELHYLLGVIYEEVGDRTKALKHLNKVISCEFNYKDAQDRLRNIEESK